MSQLVYGFIGVKAGFPGEIRRESIIVFIEMRIYFIVWVLFVEI